MSGITITLPEERLEQLRQLAATYRLSPEDLVRLSLEDLLTGSDAAVQAAVKEVLEKNRELYQRLA